MSRGRTRNRRKRRPAPHRTVIAGSRIGQESQRSANYRNGATIRYTWRIQGPTFPVKETRL
jgi:hypothetical protein